MSFSSKAVSAHLKRGEYSEVDRLCREALASDQTDGEAWHLRGLAAMGAGAPERAVQYILRAIFHRPGDCAMHINLGLVLSALQRFEEAGRAFEEAVRFSPTSFDAQFTLGSHYFDRQQLTAADAALAAAVTVRPDSFAAWELRARIARKIGDYEGALKAAAEALRINDALPVSHRIAGDAFTRRQDFESAHEHYLKSLRLDPEDCESNGNFGLLLARMGRYEDAIAYYRQSIRNNPSDLHTRHGLSLVLLALGQFDEGWKLYADRTWAYAEPFPVMAPTPESFPAKGDRVVLTTDQGPGEEIMFAGLLPDLLAAGIEATVVCSNRLVSLFERSFPSARIVTRRRLTEVSADWQIGLADTAKWLRQSFADFPRHSGYLRADAKLTATLRDRYAGNSRLPLIGISWSTIKVAKVSPQKTIPLHRWGSILSVPGVRFVSLQYGPCEEEINAAEEALGIRILHDPSVDPMRDLDAFTSQVAAMDLVITTSNTTAHVAGGLNIPTWTLVPEGHGAFWHWFLDRSDSPWYPSVRLFRQKVQGDWQPCLDEISARLADFLHGPVET